MSWHSQYPLQDELDEISEDENIEAMETDADRQQKQLEKNLEPVSGVYCTVYVFKISSFFSL